MTDLKDPVASTPVRVVGWEIQSLRDDPPTSVITKDKPDEKLRLRFQRYSPLILAHAEAGWLSALDKEAVEWMDKWDIIQQIRAHAKELRELK